MVTAPLVVDLVYLSVERLYGRQAAAASRHGSLFWVFGGYLSCNSLSSSKLNRSLRHLKRSEVPSPPLVRSGHLTTRSAKFPTSILAKSRIGFVQNEGDVFPFYGKKKKMVLDRDDAGVVLLLWLLVRRLTMSRSVGASSRRAFDGDVEVGAVLASTCWVC